MTDRELIIELQKDIELVRNSLYKERTKTKDSEDQYWALLKKYQQQLVKCKQYQDYIDSKEISPILKVGTRWVQNGMYVV